MAPTKNNIQLELLDKKLLVQPQRLAVGINLAKLHHVMQVEADEDAPHFVKGSEPLQDGRAYRAKDGQSYYRPQLRVAQRAVEPVGPDVRFLKDADGSYWLHFALEEAPAHNLATQAEPFNVRVDELRLEWREAGGTKRRRVFDQPTLVATENPPKSVDPNFLVRVGAKLDSEEVESLFAALRDASSQAKVMVKLSYGYWIDEAESSRSPKTNPVNPRPIDTRPITRVPSRFIGMLPVKNLNAQPVATRVITTPHKIRPLPENVDHVRRIIEDAKVRDHRSDFKRVTLERSIPFTFDPELAQNRHIYSALLAQDSLGEGWVNTSFGWIRHAPFPNTIYRLPDEVRLAYNAELGLPHMMAALYEDAEGEARVRVTLGAAPWHDPQKLTGLRDYLYDSTAGALASPAVVVGGYESAKLRLTSAFPEEIRSLAGEEAFVSLDGGFKITLDLSLEFYKFLCELLTGGIGLTGEVTVALETKETRSSDGTSDAESNGNDRGVIERIIPVRLNLDDLAGLPLEIRVEKEAISPTRVELVNQTGTRVRVGGCAARLLQYDPNSVVPISVVSASTQAPFPLELEERGTATIDLQPDSDDDQLLWNAVAVEILGQDLTETPTEVLDRVHAVAATATLTWAINVECPLFLAPSMPEAYAMLYKVEVQISRPGYAPQQVVLGRNAATGTVTMRRGLSDILGEEAGAIGRFTYQVRNVYFDRQGAWSEPKEGEGSNLFIFPNPVDQD